MKYKISPILSVSSLLIASFGFLFIFGIKKADSFAIVDKERLFNQFKMTKETGNQINILNNQLKAEYDSLSYTYSTARNETIRIDVAQKLEKLRIEIENLNGPFREQETLKIWKRIQSYTETYSENKNYTFVFGFENNGDIVFYKKGKDITDELLYYINKRYEGIN